MKKFLSLILAFVIALGIFVPCAYADEPQLPNLTAICGKFNFTNSYGDSYTYYIKNGKILQEGVKISDELNIKLNILFDWEYIYLYLPSFPFFHIKFDVSNFDYSDLEDFETIEYTYVKSYNKKIGNTTFYVDEFTFEDGILKDYYSDNELKFWETTYDDGSTQTTTIESTEVDDKIMKIPFYSIDITFIFNWIFNHTLIAF